MQIWESEKLRIVRNIEAPNNSKIDNFWSQILDFSNWKFLDIYYFFNLENSKNCEFGKIWIICNLEDSKNCQFEKSKNVQFEKLQKFPICKFQKCGISNGQTIPKFANFFNPDSVPNWQNSHNLLIYQVVKSRKFVNFPIKKIPKISNPENQPLSQNCYNFLILKIHEFSKFNNFEN